MKRGLPRMAGDRKSTAMRLHDIVGDAEAETGTGNLILDRRTPVESVKDAILFVGGNPFAAIGDLKMDRTSAIVHADGHGASWG